MHHEEQFINLENIFFTFFMLSHYHFLFYFFKSRLKHLAENFRDGLGEVLKKHMKATDTLPREKRQTRARAHTHPREKRQTGTHAHTHTRAQNLNTFRGSVSARPTLGCDSPPSQNSTGCFQATHHPLPQHVQTTPPLRARAQYNMTMTAKPVYCSTTHA